MIRWLASVVESVPADYALPTGPSPEGPDVRVLGPVPSDVLPLATAYTYHKAELERKIRRQARTLLHGALDWALLDKAESDTRLAEQQAAVREFQDRSEELKVLAGIIGMSLKHAYQDSMSPDSIALVVAAGPDGPVTLELLPQPQSPDEEFAGFRVITLSGDGSPRGIAEALARHLADRQLGDRHHRSL